MSIPVLAVLLFLLFLALVFLVRARLDDRVLIRRQNQELEDARLRIQELEEEELAARGREKLFLRQSETARSALEARLNLYEHFRDFVEGTEEFLFETDYAGRFLYANPAMLRRLGYDSQEIAAYNYIQFIEENRQPDALRFYAGQYRKRQVSTYAEWPIISRFGEHLLVGLQVRMAFDETGKITTVRVSGRDLSLQLSTRRKNRLFGELMERFLRRHPVPVLIFDDPQADWDPAVIRLVWANDSVLKLMNLDLIQVQGLNLSQISSTLTEAVSRKLDNPAEPVPWNTPREPDHTFNVVARRDEDMLMVSLTDASAETRLRDRLAGRVAELELILDSLPLDLALLSPQGRYQYLNRSKQLWFENGPGWKGLSDEEWFKSQKLDPSLALLRKAKMQEAVVKGKTSRYLEFIPDSGGRIRVRQKEYRLLRPEEPRQSPFLSFGHNITDLYHHLADARMTLDEMRFRIGVGQITGEIITPPAAEKGWLTGETGQEEPHLHLSDQAEKGFFVYPEKIEGIRTRAEACMPGLIWEADPETGPGQVVFFPIAFFCATLSLFSGQSGNRAPARIGLSVDPEGGIVFRVSLAAPPGGVLSPEVLDWLHTAWLRFGAVARTGDSTLDLELHLPLANRPETDHTEQALGWFSGKSLLVGPASNRPAELLAGELRNHGAEVTLVPSVFGLNGQLETGWFNLIVWLSDKPGEITEINPRTLKESGMKMLLYGTLPENTPLPAEITVLPPPVAMRQTMEQIWTLSDTAPVRRPDRAGNPVFKAETTGISLRFDRFLDITEGDKSFMIGLLPSYFSSLRECHEVFSTHIQTRNVEGLRFLLHKIRATVNTFEIHGLDALIREAIDRIADGNWKPETDTPRYTRKLDRICRLCEEQLRDFAREQGLEL